MVCDRVQMSRNVVYYLKCIELASAGAGYMPSIISDTPAVRYKA